MVWVALVAMAARVQPQGVENGPGRLGARSSAWPASAQVAAACSRQTAPTEHVRQGSHDFMRPPDEVEAAMVFIEGLLFAGPAGKGIQPAGRAPSIDRENCHRCLSVPSSGEYSNGPVGVDLGTPWATGSHSWPCSSEPNSLNLKSESEGEMLSGSAGSGKRLALMVGLE
jgi:hypothetical protein